MPYLLQKGEGVFMKKLAVVFYFGLVSFSAFASPDQCLSIKSNNPQLGLISDYLTSMSNSAKAIISYMKDPKKSERVVFHLGVINSSIEIWDQVMFRLQEAPLKVLTSERENILNAIKYERRFSWFDGINCYRGVFQQNCIVQRGNQTQLINVLTNLIQAAEDVMESKSVKECYLK